MSEKIHYRAGYKYQLAETYSAIFPIKPESEIVTDFIRLDKNGLLTIQKGYAWDGPTDPALDTKDSMRGSLIHDAFYQLMREKLLPVSFKPLADQILVEVCRKDGMWAARAWLWHRGVSKGGDRYVDSRYANPVLVAP